MVNFGNSVLGFLMFVFGVIFFIRTIRNRDKDFKDVFGNYISIYTGEIGLILIGLFLFFRELLKAFSKINAAGAGLRPVTNIMKRSTGHRPSLAMGRM